MDQTVLWATINLVTYSDQIWSQIRYFTIVNGYMLLKLDNNLFNNQYCLVITKSSKFSQKCEKLVSSNILEKVLPETRQSRFYIHARLENC